MNTSNIPSPSQMLLHIPTIFLSIFVGIRLSILSTYIPALHSSLPSQLYTTLIPFFSYLIHFVPLPLTLPLLLLTSLLHNSALPLIEFILLSLTTFSLHPPPPARVLPILTFLTALTFPHISQSPFLTPLFPHATALALSLIGIIHITTSPNLTTLFFSPPPRSRTSRQKRPSHPRNPLLYLPRFARLPHLFLLFYLLFQHLTSKLGRALVIKLYPRPFPPGYTLIAQHRGPTGLISIVDRVDTYIMMTADLSVLGGRYTCPNCMPDSIFAEFHVQEAVRLTGKGGDGGKNGRALCIGLGVGVVANAMRKLGCDVDVVEIDAVVTNFATRYFGLKGVHTFVQDGVRYLQNADGGIYDFVVHDVFTGGAVPVQLYTMDVWRNARRVMKEDGVLAVNFVGGLEKNNAAAGAVALIYDRLLKVFGHVKMFSDGLDSSTHNIVFFASAVEDGVKFRKPTEKDFLGSDMRQTALEEFEKFEVSRESLGGQLQDVEGSEWLLHMGQWNTSRSHVRLMKQLHTVELWPALFAHEQLR